MIEASLSRWMASQQLNKIFSDARDKAKADNGRPWTDEEYRVSDKQFWFSEAGAVWVYDECLASHNLSGCRTKVEPELETFYQTIIKPAMANEDTKAEMLRRLSDTEYSIRLLMAGK